MQVPGTYFSRSFLTNNSSVLQHQSHNRIKTAPNTNKKQCVWLDLDCSHVQKVNSFQPVSVCGQNLLDVTFRSSRPLLASEIDYQINDFVFLVRIRAPALNSLSTGALKAVLNYSTGKQFNFSMSVQHSQLFIFVIHEIL